MFHFLNHPANFVFFSAAFGFFTLLINTFDQINFAEAIPNHLLINSFKKVDEVHVMVGNDSINRVLAGLEPL